MLPYLSPVPQLVTLQQFQPGSVLSIRAKAAGDVVSSSTPRHDDTKHLLDSAKHFADLSSVPQSQSDLNVSRQCRVEAQAAVDVASASTPRHDTKHLLDSAKYFADLSSVQRSQSDRDRIALTMRNPKVRASASSKDASGACTHKAILRSDRTPVQVAAGRALIVSKVAGTGTWIAVAEGSLGKTC